MKGSTEQPQYPHRARTAAGTPPYGPIILCRTTPEFHPLPKGERAANCHPQNLDTQTATWCKSSHHPLIPISLQSGLTPTAQGTGRPSKKLAPPLAMYAFAAFMKIRLRTRALAHAQGTTSVKGWRRGEAEGLGQKEPETQIQALQSIFGGRWLGNPGYPGVLGKLGKEGKHKKELECWA